MPVPIIDLFAGPGGLGEGFSQVGWREGNPFFKIGLSVEKDEYAHQTLKLRSFVRHFPFNELPEEYYRYLSNGTDPEKLYTLSKYRDQARSAEMEAWKAELKNDPSFNLKLDHKISAVLGGRTDWVLIGGPPCQAYSIIGRIKNRGIWGYDPEKDDRHYLYLEYLRIIAEHKPAVFIMENVTGLLSSKVKNKKVFQQILNVFKGGTEHNGTLYEIYSLTKKPDSYSQPDFRGKDFIIRMEEYGIPQSRHRVILLGVRKDICEKGLRPEILQKKKPVSLNYLLKIARLRSGLSTDKNNDRILWKKAVESFPYSELKNEIISLSDQSVAELINKTLEGLSLPHADTGDNFVRWAPSTIDDREMSSWYEDRRIGGVFNHSARGHMESDLHRYLYASCFAKKLKRSPKIKDFPESLKPMHKNRDSGDFEDRFKVQLNGVPAKTITSHISKDGHYFIHPDPGQCRSLTVREAARIQTFPDNYFFCGPRTQQFNQVGNAVPPLLAFDIAKIVKKLLIEAFG